MTPAVTPETVRRAYGVASEFFVAGMDRDDLAQEALIGALEARGKWRRGLASFATFEMVCMRRNIVDMLRTSRRSRQRVLNDASSYDHLELKSAVDVSTIVEDRETLRELCATRRQPCPGGWGSAGGYNNHGCRCEWCRAAMTQSRTGLNRRKRLVA